MTGSWEIVAAKERRILLVTITPPDLAISLNWADHVEKLILPPGSIKTRISGLPWGPARNQAAKLALEQGFNLAFLDADVLPEPPNAYMKLLETGLPFCSGLYYQRFPPYMPVAFNVGQDAQGNIIKQPIGFQPGDIFPADFIPAGLCLIKHWVLEKAFARFPVPYAWGLDVAPLPDFGGGQLPNFSEDFTFSYRLKTVLGIQGFIVSSVVGLHVVQAVVGPRWMISYPSPDPTHGVVGVV